MPKRSASQEISQVPPSPCANLFLGDDFLSNTGTFTVLKMHAIGWDGEEKFVVFPLGEGGGGCGAGGEGDLIGVNLKTDMGGASEAGKIGPESVAEVEHGGWKFIAGKPVTFGETWGEGEVAAWPGATKFACDEKEMAWAGAGSVGGVVFGGCSEKRDGDKELASANGFPADDGEMSGTRTPPS